MRTTTNLTEYEHNLLKMFLVLAGKKEISYLDTPHQQLYESMQWEPNFTDLQAAAKTLYTIISTSNIIGEDALNSNNLFITLLGIKAQFMLGVAEECSLKSLLNVIKYLIVNSNLTVDISNLDKYKLAEFVNKTFLGEIYMENDCFVPKISYYDLNEGLHHNSAYDIPENTDLSEYTYLLYKE